MTTTKAQQLLRWATVPEQSGLKSGGCYAPFREDLRQRVRGSLTITVLHKSTYLLT